MSECIYDISFSSITYYPYYCSWTIFQSIGLNMFPSDLSKSCVIIYDSYSEVPPFGLVFVWWRGLTTYLLYISRILVDLVLNNSGFIHFTQHKTIFQCFGCLVLYQYVIFFVWFLCLMQGILPRTFLLFFFHWWCNDFFYISNMTMK